MSPGEKPMVVLTDAGEILAVLDHPELFGFPIGDSRAGSTAALRAAMARFSGPDEHADRRTAVVDAIRSAGTERALAFAADRTSRRLDGQPFDGMDIALMVPTEALALCLELSAPLDRIVADMNAIVRVIGRGQPGSAEADAATD